MYVSGIRTDRYINAPSIDESAMEDELLSLDGQVERCGVKDRRSGMNAR